MFRIEIADRPTAQKIPLAYSNGIYQIKKWISAIAKSLGITSYSIYVRGSVCHGETGKNSDLDLVVLIPFIYSQQINLFKNTLIKLIQLYHWAYHIDLKCMLLNTDLSIEPPCQSQEPFYALLKKYINFDLYANGVCLQGDEIKNQSGVYDSSAEFIKANQLFWGDEIRFLIKKMLADSLFQDYYHLIKRCIRLASYSHFESNAIYYGSVQKCYSFVMTQNNPIKKQLTILFNNLNEDIIEKTHDEIECIKNSINMVANYILLSE